ncbi:hypothetical protein, partial [Stenotrophomonas maltophilia group sp. CASM10]|uniref:hypothetical protein n=1 Tax=Stenotrophomonas maltophilia group sp. CASM10 TaxID=3111513 RepID=UPI003BF7D660
AAAGTAEHRLGSTDPPSSMARRYKKAGIRSGFARGYKEGLSALFTHPGRFSLPHKQLQDGSGMVQCWLMAF